MQLYEPLTVPEQEILDEYHDEAPERTVERLEQLTIDLSRRLEDHETWHTLTNSQLNAVLHAAVFARRLIFEQRDKINQLNGRCYEQTLDSLVASRGVGGYVG